VYRICDILEDRRGYCRSAGFNQSDMKEVDASKTKALTKLRHNSVLNDREYIFQPHFKVDIIHKYNQFSMIVFEQFKDQRRILIRIGNFHGPNDKLGEV